MGFVYKMVQIPPTITVDAKSHRGTEAAAYLEGIVNRLALEGWEFYRVDQVGVSIPPGCLGALGGQSASHKLYFVVTFRKPA